MNRNYHLLFYLLLSINLFTAPVFSQSHINWTQWAELPDNPELFHEGTSLAQPGLAGAYSGLSGNVMIVTGGANFPYATPWNGGAKIYWDQIYLYRLNGDNPGWMETEVKLPVAMAYGVTVQHGDDLILVGGENKDGTVSEVVSLRWDPSAQDIELMELAPLPVGFLAIGGGLADGKLLIHGVQGGENVLLQNDLKGSWLELPGCPGPPRYFPVSQIQSNGRVEGLYLFSGRTQDDSGEIKLLIDGYMYDPVQKTWTLLGDVGSDPNASICLMGASSVRSGANHIIIFGGDDGRELLERVDVLNQIDLAESEDHKAELRNHLDGLFMNHTGFSREIRAYHTITNTWSVLDTFPGLLPVTTNAFSWNNQYFITSGEIHPGLRTPVIWKGVKME